MLHSTLSQVTALATAGVSGWALVAGRWPERVAAATIALDWAGDLALQDMRPYHHLQTAFVVLDVAQAAVLLTLVVASRRTWILWAAAFALLAVFTHVTVMLNTSFGQWSYLTVLYIWGIGLVLSLAAGMALEGRKPVSAPFAPGSAL